MIRIQNIIIFSILLLSPWICVPVVEAASVGGGLEITDTEQRHSAPLTISVLDVLEERFPVRAGRSSPVEDLPNTAQNKSPSLGIQPRKLSFSPDLEGVENLLGRTENEGEEVPRDHEKITYDHHLNPSLTKDVEKEEFGFEVESESQLRLPTMPVVQKNVEGAKVRNESESKESLNSSFWAQEVKVTSQNTSATMSSKLVFEKGSSSETRQGDGITETPTNTSQSFIYHPVLIRPTPTPPQVFRATASPKSQLVQNLTEAESASETKNHFTRPKFTTQLVATKMQEHQDISTLAFSNNTNSLNRTMGSPEVDHLEIHHLVVGDTDDLLETFVRDILFPDDLDLGLFSQEKSGKVPLGNVTTTTRTDFPLWLPSSSQSIPTKPKPKSSALMSTFAVTGIFLISILMLLSLLSHVLFSSPSPIASSRTEEELFPSSTSNNFHPMTLAWGEFPRFKEPATTHIFLHERRKGGEGRNGQNQISIINSSSSSFISPNFPFHHFYLNRK